MPGAVQGFNKMPAELQGMVAIEALRRPGVNWVRVARDTDSGRWLARLQPLPANRDDSSFRLFGRLTRDVGSGVIRRAILAASKDNQTDVKLQVRQTDRQKKGIRFSMDMDTELVFLDFGRGQGGPEAHFRWYEASDPSRANIQRLGNVFSPFKKAAVEYRNSWTSCVGWKASTPFQCWCADPHRTYHKKFKLCPQEVFNMLECFQNLEDFYVVVTKPAQNGRKKPEGYWGMCSLIPVGTSIFIVEFANRTSCQS